MEQTRVATVRLGDEARVMFGFAGPRLIAATFVVTLVARVAVGAWNWVDVAIAAGILAFEPFTEWLIHVFILHAKPRRIGSLTIDPLLARAHRQHHADPKDRKLVLVPLPTLLIAIPVGAALVLLLVDPLPRALTALVVASGMLLTYEWTHHLIHTAYRPKGRYYRSISRAHRLHHHRNEHYWFGVTMHLADHVLRTYPARDAVPLSPTARTLGITVEDAASTSG